ncbi:MAG: alpha/beta fold hydrolase [Chloroflexi bacterium]|nr:alpha/beta fold hydrolase [Chloroflexota bacterium]
MSDPADMAHVNGTRLAYEVHGAGSPVVFIHGFSLDRRMWRAQLAPFAARHRVIAYDARGFGQSAPATVEPYADVDDLRALLDYLDVDAAHVIGLSMGGGIAIDMALTHPERVRGLVLVDSALNGWTFSPAWHAAWAPIGAAIDRGDIAGATALWLAHPVFAVTLAQPASAAALRAMVEDYARQRRFQPADQRSPQPPARQRLEQIAAPTLVIVGESDIADAHAISAELARRIPDARQVVLSDAGHMANMDNPATFNDVVLRFLAAH